MTLADLHVHTTASDGQHSPAEVVARAQACRLTVIAITDHDTSAGVAAAQAAAPACLEVIPGIELGARVGASTVDVLGYFINPQHPVLQQHLEDFRQDRERRGQAIVERLCELGLMLDWQQVQAQAGGGIVGRPHIAQALVAAGYVQSTVEAFERYLGSHGPAYVARQTLSPEAAVQLIQAAGGAAVLAHPVYVHDFSQMVARLVLVGLDGIEVYYPDHTPEIQARAQALAHEYDLIMTGGSDFHGVDFAGKAPLGSVTAPPDAVERLRQRAARYR
jgi:3',5'-nucleoside bisphosphate phosphatase